MPNKYQTKNANERASATHEEMHRISGGSSVKNESERIFPFTELRLYVINKSAHGDVSYLLVKENFSTILSYRVHTEKWQYTENLVDFGVVSLNKFIYVIGGFHKVWKKCVNRVMRFDPAEVTWSECTGLLSARCKFGVCTSRGQIYVCGGEQDGRIIASCEIYDPVTETWTQTNKLVEPRSSCSCTALGKVILCAGGYYKGLIHDNLWMYSRNQWQVVMEFSPQRLPYIIQNCALTVANNKLYFIGGVSSTDQTGVDNAGKEIPINMPYTERRMFSSCDVTNKGSQPWNVTLPPMLYARQNAGVVTLGQNIHVIGGTTVETGDAINVSERFDLVRGEWIQDFTLKHCDVSNVTCVLHEVPKAPMSERKMVQQRLKWVMW